jgi:hypothetical protein
MRVILIPLVLLVILPIVFSESPPALPMELWGLAYQDGNLVSDGLNISATINGKNFAQGSVTSGGYYDTIITDLDRPLTYNSDPTCAAHWASGSACVTCTPCSGANCLLGYNESTCIEGPADGSNVTVKIGVNNANSIFSLQSGSISNNNLIIVTLVLFSKNLSRGWNMVSIPLQIENDSISSVFSSINGSYDIIWTIVNGDWKSSTSRLGPITAIASDKGYLIFINKNSTLALQGAPFGSKTISTSPVWNTVGYPSQNPMSISSALSGLNYNIVWTIVNGDWKSSTSRLGPITTMYPGEGYLLSTQTGGNYTINN